MNKLKRSKKGQFYILTAIVLIAYATLLIQSDSTIPKSTKIFKSTFENFESESTYAINNALFEQKSVTSEFEDFVDSFISYSKMKKLNVEIFSIVQTRNIIHFSNKMNNPVKIIELNATIQTDSSQSFSKYNVSVINVEVKDDVFHENIYKFSISNDKEDVMAILRIVKGSEREIFVLE